MPQSTAQQLDIRTVARERLGFDALRPGQEAAIAAVLDGHDTLWFARAREGSDDYSRMARQKCVMSAMLQQVSPQVALRNF